MANAQNPPPTSPNARIVLREVASVGITALGGIAAALATDLTVVVATGDGGLLTNGAEIETVTRLRQEQAIVGFCEDGSDLPSENQIAPVGGHFPTETTDPVSERFVECIGIDDNRPEIWNTVGTTLERIVLSTQLYLVERALG